MSLVGRGDLAGQVYRGLRAAILDGRLRAGDRLPPSRELARSLAVSRNTVTIAYERLIAEGFLTSRVGAGTFVDQVPVGRPTSRPSAGLRPRPDWAYWPAATSGERTLEYDFRVGIPDAGLFPFDTWRRLVAHDLRRTAHGPGTYAPPTGYPPLREAIARYVGIARSVRAEPDDVLVTSGAQQALDLIGRVLVGPGDVVAVEEPGYPPARALFSSLGARVVGVPVDAEGLVVDRLPRKARLVFTTPSHQMPLGVPMSLSRRAALLAWAERAGAAVIEDDYDSEFRFADRPLDSLHSLDTGGRVVYVGTFSKTMLPALRLGFLVAPVGLRAALAGAKQLVDWYSPIATQAALAHFADSGQLAAHIRRTTKQYRRRRDAVLSALAADDRLVPMPSVAGLHVSARLRYGDAARARAVARAALASGVGIEPLAGYCAGQPQAGFVFGYGNARAERIPDGMAIINKLLR